MGFSPRHMRLSPQPLFDLSKDLIDVFLYMSVLRITLDLLLMSAKVFNFCFVKGAKKSFLFFSLSVINASFALLSYLLSIFNVLWNIRGHRGTRQDTRKFICIYIKGIWDTFKCIYDLHSGILALSNLWCSSVTMFIAPACLMAKTALMRSCYLDVRLQILDREKRQIGPINIVTLDHHRFERSRLPLWKS